MAVFGKRKALSPHKRLVLPFRLQALLEAA
jgi:hypothetical protein